MTEHLDAHHPWVSQRDTVLAGRRPRMVLVRLVPRRDPVRPGRRRCPRRGGGDRCVVNVPSREPEPEA